MANGAFAPSRLGSNNLNADQTAQFMILFGNLVLREFERKNVMMSRHDVKTLTTGIAHKFDRIGRATASYHTPGVNIFDSGSGMTSQMRHGQFYIAADKILTSATTIDDLDEVINHYDARVKYAAELARVLSDTFDENVMRVLLKAARTGSGTYYTASPGGATVRNNTSDTDGGALLSAIKSCAQAADEKHWSREGRTFITTPAGYYNLIDNKDVINVDYGNAGNGSLRSGMVAEAYGFEIVASNTLLDLNNAGAYSSTAHQLDGASGTNVNDYALDPTNGGADTVTGIAFQRTAVGSVKKIGMNVEMEKDFDTNSTKVKAQYSIGHGIVRPEAAIEVVAAA